MDCHLHAVKDFELQLEMNKLQIDMVKDGGEVMHLIAWMSTKTWSKRSSSFLLVNGFIRTHPMHTGTTCKKKKQVSKRQYNS
jgi:hypothetical protein